MSDNTRGDKDLEALERSIKFCRPLDIVRVIKSSLSSNQYLDLTRDLIEAMDSKTDAQVILEAAVRLHTKSFDRTWIPRLFAKVISVLQGLYSGTDISKYLSSGMLPHIRHVDLVAHIKKEAE